MAELPKLDPSEDLNQPTRNDSGFIQGEDVSASVAGDFDESVSVPSGSAESTPLAQSNPTAHGTSAFVALNSNVLPVSVEQLSRRQSQRDDSEEDNEDNLDPSSVLPHSTSGSGFDIPVLVGPSATSLHSHPSQALLHIVEVGKPQQQLQLLKDEHGKLFREEREATNKVNHGLSALLKCIEVIISKMAEQDPSDSSVLQECVSFKEQLQTERRIRCNQSTDLLEPMKVLSLESEATEEDSESSKSELQADNEVQDEDDGIESASLDTPLTDDENLALEKLLSNEKIDPSTVLSDSNVTLRSVQQKLCEMGQKELASNLRSSLERIMYEQQKHVEMLECLMVDEKKVLIRYITLFFLGPPNVGKTTTRDRLLGAIENISEAGEKRVVQSTLLANCNQILAFINGDKWLSSEDTEEETQLLFGFLREIVPTDNDSSAPPQASADQGVTKCVSSITPVPVSEPPSSKLESVIKHLKHLIKLGDYSKFTDMSGSGAFLNIHDIGGQPGFLQILPALIRGPAVYLPCFKMSKNLDESYPICFNRKEVELTPYESLHTVKATIFQILSSVANIKCILHEPIPSGAPSEFCEMFEKFMNISPVALLVGTHKDEIVDKCEDKVKELNESLQSVVETFNIMAILDDDELFFPVDNLNGTDSDDIAPIRNFIKRHMLKNHFKDAALPIRPNWLLFGITLRNEYRIVEMSHCLKIGRVLKMNEDEVKFCLWYLHHCVGTLMYFPSMQDEWFKNHVICSPQVIFDSISQLILPSLQALHSKGPYLAKDKKEWVEKGLFSIQSIKRYCTSVTDTLGPNEVLPIERLVELLEHVNIISPINDGGQTTYFMPAVLESVKLEGPPAPDPDNPEPLFITFSCGYVPTGVFCGLITRLVSLSNNNTFGLKWKLKRKCMKQNCVSFNVNNVNVVTLLSHEKCYEIRVTRRQDIDLHDLCAHVLSTVLYVLKNLYEHITPIIAFQCPCSEHPSAVKHNQYLCTLVPGHWLQCLCENDEVILRDSQRVWIGKNVTPGTCAHLEVLKYDKQKKYGFHWSKYGDGVTDSMKELMELSGKKLSFKNIEKKHFGHYKCQISEAGKTIFTTYRALYEGADETNSQDEQCEPEPVQTLDSEIKDPHMIFLAQCFDDAALYLDLLGLSKGEKTDVGNEKTNQQAMNKALCLWRSHKPSQATYKALIDLVQSLRNGEIARDIEEYFDKNVKQ